MRGRLAKWLPAGKIKIGPREKAWLVLLAAVGVLSLGYRKIVHPRIEAARKARMASFRLDGELSRLNAKRPDVQGRRAQVEALKARVAETYHQLEALEDGLLNRQDLDVLLQQVVANQQRLHLQINAVKPLKDDGGKSSPQERATGEGAFYKRLLIQIDAYGAFNELIAYAKALEGQAPYQRIQGIAVKVEGQEMVRPRALILLQTLLAESPQRLAERRQEVFELVEQAVSRETKDPFLPSEKPKEEQLAVGLELNGVFGANGAMTALINGEGYHVGDVIQGKRIVVIQPDRVILEQGSRRFFLYGGRSSE